MGCAKKLLVAAGRHDELAKFQKFVVRHGAVMPNTYKARTVNRKKHSLTESFFLSVSASSERSFRLDFFWQLGTEFRLNIRRRSEAMAGQAYSDSIGPQPVLAFGPNQQRSSSPVIRVKGFVR